MKSFSALHIILVGAAKAADNSNEVNTLAVLIKSDADAAGGADAAVAVAPAISLRGSDNNGVSGAPPEEGETNGGEDEDSVPSPPADNGNDNEASRVPPEEGETDGGEDEDPVPYAPPAPKTDCSGTKLVSIYSGKDDACATDTPSMYWPIASDPENYCFGWSALSNNGESVLNSAKNIRCSEDGLAITYTQFIENLECTGTGTDKHFTLDSCEVGRPPSLRDMGLDLSCCSDPASEACAAMTGTPMINFMGGRTGEYVSVNGEICE